VLAHHVASVTRATGTRTDGPAPPVAWPSLGPPVLAPAPLGDLPAPGRLL